VGTGPKSWLRPPNLAALLTDWSVDSRKTISKFDATRCQILRLKCTKFDFRWGSASDAAGGAYSAPQTPAVFKVSTSGWWRGTVVERRSLAGELSLSCA